MARLVPPGSSVNMGIGDPLSKLNKTLDTFSKLQSIIGNQQALTQKRDTSAMNTLATLNGLIGGADDKGDLTYAQNIYDNLDINDMSNPNTELVHGMIGRELSSKKETFDNIFASGNELANLMTSEFSVYDSEGKGPMAEKRLSDMNANELINYFNSVKGDKGALGEITKLNDKINKFYMQTSTVFGMTKEGQFQKRPNFKFTDANGTEIDPSEYMLQLQKYQNRLNIFIESGFNDGILNIEEAESIVNGDTVKFEALKKRRDAEYKFLAQQGLSTKKAINTKIVQLSKATDKESQYNQIYEMLDSPGLIDEVFELTEGGDSFQLTSDPEENRKNAAMYMSSRNTLDENLQFFQKYLGEVDSQFQRHKKGAQSWGFGYFGLDDKRELANTETTGFFENLSQDNKNEIVTPVLDENNNQIPDYIEQPEGAGKDKITVTKSDGSEEKIDSGVVINEALSDDALGISTKPPSKDKSFWWKYEEPLVLGGGASAAGVSYLYGNKIADVGRNLKSAYNLPSNAIRDYISGNPNNPLGNITMSSEDIAVIDTKVKKIDKTINKVDSQIKHHEKELKNYNAETEKIKNKNTLDKNKTIEQAELENKKRELGKKKIEKKIDNTKKRKASLEKNKVKIEAQKTNQGRIAESYAKKNRLNVKNVKNLIENGSDSRTNVYRMKAAIDESLEKGYKTLKRTATTTASFGAKNYIGFSLGEKVADYLGYEILDLPVVGDIGAGALGMGGQAVLRNIYDRGIRSRVNNSMLTVMMRNQQNIIASRLEKELKKQIWKKGWKMATKRAALRGTGYLVAAGTTGGVTPVSVAGYILNTGLILTDVYAIAKVLFHDELISDEERQAIIDEGKRLAALSQKEFLEEMSTMEGRKGRLAMPSDSPQNFNKPPSENIDFKEKLKDIGIQIDEFE